MPSERHGQGAEARVAVRPYWRPYWWRASPRRLSPFLGGQPMAVRPCDQPQCWSAYSGPPSPCDQPQCWSAHSSAGGHRQPVAVHPPAMAVSRPCLCGLSGLGFRSRPCLCGQPPLGSHSHPWRSAHSVARKPKRVGLGGVNVSRLVLWLLISWFDWPGYICSSLGVTELPRCC